MAGTKVYDKVSWHFPEGKNCPSLEAAKHHFVIIMNWLKKNDLLSEEGKEAFEAGIDSDFALTSDMLNKKGNKIIEKYYPKWLKNIDYNKNANFEILNNALGDTKYT